MRRVFLTVLAIGSVSAAVPAAGQSADEAEIRRLAIRQGETWSRGDVKGYVALFAGDCDVVNIMGWRWKGRAEAERKLTEAFKFVFKDSKLTITDVDTRFVRPDVAVSHVRWTMTGAKMPPGLPAPRTGIQTVVFSRQGGRWLIIALQNTVSVPERPFPAGPGEARPKQ